MATVYLSSPRNQTQAHMLQSMPVLVSFALWSPWMANYLPSFGQVMADSGAFSELNSGKRVDVGAYGEWLEHHRSGLDAAAGLDDISGDWKRSLANWDRLPHTFPTLHDSDPPEYIEAVLDRLQDDTRARLRPTDRQWVGIGLVPPRKNRGFVFDALSRIPQGVHVHCFALRGLAPQVLAQRGPDVSFDSTNWLLDAQDLLRKGLDWLTPAERIELIVKRYQRQKPQPTKQSQQVDIFGGDK